MVNVVCVLWGTRYPANTVVRLWRQVRQHLQVPFQFVVFTEAQRQVPSEFLRRDLPALPECPGWWHKMAIFDSQQLAGPTLYLDLDVTIVGTLNWVTEISTDHLVAIRNFDYLWNSNANSFNSSMMWFDTSSLSDLYARFSQNPSAAIDQYHGDQDWLTAAIPSASRRFFPETRIASYRWQCVQGGWDAESRCYRQPQAITTSHDASVVVFHGNPKPWEIPDSERRLLGESV